MGGGGSEHDCTCTSSNSVHSNDLSAGNQLIWTSVFVFYNSLL